MKEGCEFIPWVEARMVGAATTGTWAAVRIAARGARLGGKLGASLRSGLGSTALLREKQVT